MRWIARRRVSRPLVRSLLKLRVLRSYRISPISRPRDIVRYVLTDREVTNFTYDLANERDIAPFVAQALALPEETIATYVAEASCDRALAALLGSRLAERDDRNRTPRFGRRLGWYAVVRAVKPGLVVETGTHDGLGTALLARALQRNADEGAEGQLLSFDITPGSGWLVPDEVRRFVRIIIGDVREELPRELTGRTVDVFIHDSAHTYEHELFEYDLAMSHAAETLVLISDNAHASTALEDLAAGASTEYHYFAEQPRGHFYPGAGIGLTVWRRNGSRQPSRPAAH